MTLGNALSIPSLVRCLAAWFICASAVLACGSESTRAGGSEAGSGGASTEPDQNPDAGAGGSSAEPALPSAPVDEVAPDDGVYQAVETEAAAFVDYESAAVEYTPSVAGYELPVQAGDVLNLERDIQNNALFAWTGEAEARLLDHGLVMVAGSSNQRHFDAAYNQLQAYEIPILVTTDSTLHLYHIFFDQLLKNIELESIIPMFDAMLPALADTLASMYVALEGDAKEAARRDLAFVSAAAALLASDGFTVYDVVQEEVEAVVHLAQEAAGKDVEPILNRDCPRDVACAGGDLDDDAYLEGRACLCEDWTQYKPRGHYTEHEDLKRYFRSAMYLGRVGLRIKSPMETLMAALLTAGLSKTKVDYEGQAVPAAEVWNRVYRVTSFFAGTSDDLTFIEYDQVLREVYGEDFQLMDLASDPDLAALRTALEAKREPAILSGFVAAGLDKSKQTMGLRVFGQRFAFDSYVLGELVFDHVGPNPLDPNYDYVLKHLNPDCRVELADQPITEQFDSCDGQTLSDWNYVCCSAIGLAKSEGRAELADVCRLLPSGLDVAAAFGSARAREHLQDDIAGFCSYREKLDGVAQEASEFTLADWGKNLYTAWLYSLDPFFTQDFSEFPTWMQGQAYSDKGLNTALASWAELRHDTILYVKQSYTSMGVATGMPTPPPEAMYYVEPIPEVYSRLADLARMTETGLSALEMFPAGVSDSNARLIDLLDRLKEISIHELEGAALTQSEIDFVDGVGDTIAAVLSTLGRAVTLEPTEPEPDDPYTTIGETVEGDPYKTTVVADVHTDGNMEEVLEVGSGYIEWVVVVNRLQDGSLGAAVGPVLSYYEFAWPMNARLTDTEWQELLGSEDCPERPGFLAAIR
jgi:hypothetical protein